MKCGMKNALFLFKLFPSFPHVNSRAEISARAEIGPCNQLLNVVLVSLVKIRPNAATLIVETTPTVTQKFQPVILLYCHHSGNTFYVEGARRCYHMQIWFEIGE